MLRVINYTNKNNESETETITGIRDVMDIVEKNLGSDMKSALTGCISEKIQATIDNLPNGNTFIEEGVWWEQIQESEVVKKIIEKLLKELKEQDFLKKNKKIENFEVNENEMIEIIDNELYSGIKNYFTY